MTIRRTVKRVLDGDTFRTYRKIKLKRLSDNIIQLRDKNNSPLGVFSLSKQFINYVLKKDKYYERTFSFVDVIINKKNLVKISRLEIDKPEKEKLKEISIE